MDVFQRHCSCIVIYWPYISLVNVCSYSALIYGVVSHWSALSALQRWIYGFVWSKSTTMMINHMCCWCSRISCGASSIFTRLKRKVEIYELTKTFQICHLALSQQIQGCNFSRHPCCHAQNGVTGIPKQTSVGIQIIFGCQISMHGLEQEVRSQEERWGWLPLPEMWEVVRKSDEGQSSLH